jgi:hypothetical protein
VAVAYAPTPEEEEAQRLAAAGAAPPVVDAVSGGEAPPPPTADLTTDQLMAAATAPEVPVDAPLPTPGAPAPAGAPGDAVDQVIAANPLPPAPQPPVVAAPAPPPADMTAPGAVQKAGSAALAEQGQLPDQAVAAEKSEGAAKQEMALAEAKAAEEKAEIAKQAAADQKLAMDAANKRSQRWLDRADEETSKLMSMQPTDFWAGKSTGDKVLAGLSMLFGAAGRTDNTTNPGMQMVDKAIERHFRQEAARIDKQKANVQAAGARYDDSLTAKQQLLADNELKKAAAYDVAAAQLISLKMRKGATLEQAQTDKDVAALRQKANAGRLDTLNTIHQWNVQDEQVKIGHARAAAMAARAAAIAKKKGGGGGGDGVPSVKEQNAMATLSGKVDGVVQKVIQNTGYKESVVQNRKYNQMAATLAGAKDNAALAAAGAGQFVKMAQGGTGVISDSDMDIFWKRVGGKLSGDALEQMLNDWTNGKLVAGKQKIVGDAIRELAKGAKSELDGIGTQIRTRLEGEANDIPWVKSRIPVYLNTYVPGLTGQAAPAQAAATPAAGGAKGPAKASAPAKKLTDQQLAKQVQLKMQAKQVVNDPKADPAVKRDAQAYLDRIGG